MKPKGVSKKFAYISLALAGFLSPLNTFTGIPEKGLEKVLDSYKKVSDVDKFVENARKYIGISYEGWGRMTEKNPGLDCMGLVFGAYSETFGVPWTNISVNPSEIVKTGQLGEPVEGLNGVLKENINLSKLEKGDIIYLLSTKRIEDAPLAVIKGREYWPWHMGIYSSKEKNQFLEAHPGDKVLEHNFSDVLNDDFTEGIFVTRFDEK